MIKTVPFLFFALLLSGCLGKTPPMHQGIVTPVVRHNVDELTQWKWTGKLVVKTPNKAESLRIIWEQSHPNYRIRLTPPLGGSGVEMSRRAGWVFLRTADQKQYQSNSGDELIREHSPWPLPISSLYYWVRGLPEPNKALSDPKKEGHLWQSFQQQGWQVDYVSYQQNGQLQLPKKIYLQHRELKLRLLINRWQLTKLSRKLD